MAVVLLFATLAQGSEACVACHPREVSGYLQTGMGRSMSRPVGQPSGSFEHFLSRSTFTIVAGKSGMTQRVERDGIAAEYPVEYVIGSGNAAFGYLIRVGNHVYQSPIAYYTKRDVWDMAPGMESHRNPDFDRPVLPECLWCHAGRPLPVSGTQNRYRDAILAAEAISCDRCHGPAEAHLAKPSAETIVNPAKLAAAERASVCEQCHLSGRARVLNPGRDFGDFQPGMLLEEVFSVYVDDQPAASLPGTFKVVSHFEQLALSRCAQQSGAAMWCGTCHNPHEKPTDPVAYYRERCVGCHASLTESHPQPAGDCVSCHMTRRHSRDSAHSAFTDHLISRQPRREGGSQAAGKLRAWREPEGSLAERNLGLAYLEIGQRERLEFYLDEGSRLLAKPVQLSPNDPPALSAMGSVLMLKNAPPGSGVRELALRLLEDAVRLDPENAVHARTLAAAHWQLRDGPRAIALLNRAIELDPFVEAAYRVLARIYEDSGKPGQARETWRRYLERLPQDLYARQELRRLEVNGDLNEASK